MRHIDKLSGVQGVGYLGTGVICSEICFGVVQGTCQGVLSLSNVRNRKTCDGPRLDAGKETAVVPETRRETTLFREPNWRIKALATDCLPTSNVRCSIPDKLVES